VAFGFASSIGGGMVPKMQGCAEAVRSGVGSVHLVDGRIPHVLLLELFTDAGVGTMVTPGPADVLEASS
jgi:acetylglutamate kinase